MTKSFDRRKFLKVSTGGLVLATAACSSDGAGDGVADTVPGTDAPATAPDTTSAPASPTTTAETIETTTTVAEAVDSPLLAPGSPGLIDEATFQARADEYLAFATTDIEEVRGPTAVAAHLARARRDPDFTWPIEDVTVDTFSREFERIDEWQDTRDFSFMYLLWCLELGQGDTEMTQLSPDVIEAIRQRVVENRYRYDDPLPDDRIDELWYWSENHQIINLTIEYLGGQRFPEDVFVVTGLTGAEHMDRARPRIFEWIQDRGKLGFFEFHSNIYMLKNVTPLHQLVEQADDPEIVQAAAMALDLCVLDMAAHLQNGSYTAPRGRSSKVDNTSSLDEDTFGTQKFLFDDTDAPYQTLTDNGATYLSASQRYRPPQLLIDIASDNAESIVRERHGVYLDPDAPLEEEPVAPYGKDFSDRENLMFWWGLGGLGLWQMARTGIAEGNEYRLYETELFEDIAAISAINDNDPERVRTWLHRLDAIVNFGFLSEANTYAYRHPKVSLASVLDHRFGEMRDQLTSWQAAVDPEARIFTTHPLTEPATSENWRDDEGPGYWTGTASSPRSAQYRRTAVHIYQPAWDETTDGLLWSVFPYRPFTHAFVPQDRFDEVRQVGNWTLVTKSGGHIALWSWRTPQFRTDPGAATGDYTAPFDLVADGGPDNVWIVEVGNDDDDGDFETFVATITESEPAVERTETEFLVAWTSPSSGTVEFSSTGAFVVGGSEQPIGDHPRHESPWGMIEHESPVHELSNATNTWRLDFDQSTRELS